MSGVLFWQQGSNNVARLLKHGFKLYAFRLKGTTPPTPHDQHPTTPNNPKQSQENETAGKEGQKKRTW